uniref:Uncharacterized protein n=1 Tax=Oryza glumipatula TaxID=40148 RepID=A0A0D9ZHI2_9ORYZ
MGDPTDVRPDAGTPVDAGSAAEEPAEAGSATGTPVDAARSSRRPIHVGDPADDTLPADDAALPVVDAAAIGSASGEATVAYASCGEEEGASEREREREEADGERRALIGSSGYEKFKDFEEKAPPDTGARCYHFFPEPGSAAMRPLHGEHSQRRPPRLLQSTRESSLLYHLLDEIISN